CATGGYTSYAFFNPKGDYAGVVLLNDSQTAGPNGALADLLGRYLSRRLAGGDLRCGGERYSASLRATPGSASFSWLGRTCAAISLRAAIWSLGELMLSMAMSSPPRR